jgi:serine/threonine protein kinase/Tol biopolymer transport system component/Tfp pilus assembly protein PilF
VSVRDEREREIFERAIEITSLSERVAYVEDACAENEDLTARIQALLRAHDQAGFLPAYPSNPEVTLSAAPISECPGTIIGRYKLLEKIGEGGMAVVYMAEQTEPIQRKVALKIIKLGMDTRQVIARFEAERQALALMDHPNIAKVLDAGATEAGRPYFVMELVQGVSVTKYCDTNSLSTKDRLALFLQVCHAVQHAHQKGIIHRDIKPSNVMVTHHDGKPVPKVIDFGIAKATNQKLTEKTLFTRYAHLIGTPAYMSPEQAELSDLDIDTRSDIYSLGVLLYELLTGTTPFSEEELRQAGYFEMQRVIREQEPVKPSTRISTLGHTSTEIAERRGSTPDLLRKAIRGDLDWIVMKSLEKDRVRRYETASGLAEDIRRHLEHEPILARSPGAAYRVQKFLRRHRTQMLAALAVAILAVAGVIVLSLWHRNRLQLVDAEGLRHQAILSQAREQYAKADRDTALGTIQPILDSKHVGPEAQLLKAGILVDNRRSEEAVTVLNKLLHEQPAIAGAAHSLLARILWESGSLDADKLKQIDAHRRQAETLLPETAEAYFLRAMTAVTVKEQLASLDRALQLDPDHYESRRLRAFTYYASRKYDRLRDDALIMTMLRRGDPLGHSLRGAALRELGKYEEAVAEYDQAMARPPQETSQYLDLAIQRCETLLRMGRYAHVVTTAQEMLELWPDKPVFQYHLFCARTALGDVNEAQEVFQKIVRSAPTARNEFWFWATKYVFDTLEAGRSWHKGGPAPKGAAFLPLVEAEETYRDLAVKARRLLVGGFGAQWSPDGKKLAFSLGVQGYSGVALYDPATKETELLIVPGKDPRWSPDGRYLAFVRDRQALRLEELTATEREDPQRWLTNEEVWVMNSDGTEPRRLARGGWPSWSRDSAQVYYCSRQEKTLCSISIAGSEVEPKRILACSSAFPSVSPDEQQVAYLEDNNSLKVKHLVSQAVVAQWRVPFGPWGGPAWSPTGHEVCLGADSSMGDRTGLWIYPLDSNEPVKVLTSQIMAASWAPDATKLVFALRPPYFELWTADLDPALSTVKALGPGQTPAEHWQDMLRLYTHRIETDPQDAYAYAERARCYDCLHERTKAEADMQRWSAIVSGRSPADLWFATRHGLRHVIDLPFDGELVFSAERPVNKIPVFSIAFGQKGRCEMKLFEMPMVVMSLVGLSFLAGLDVPARADFTFGAPLDIQSTFPINPATEYVTCFSADGLEVYFAPAVAPLRSGGQGGADLWVLTRASVEDAWGPPENLGPIVNTASNDLGASITVDGLELYFFSNRPGGYGNIDIYVTKRATRTSPWGPATNLGPEVNGSFPDQWPMVSPDGLELYLSSNRPGGLGGPDIYVSKRATTQDPWGDPANLGPAVNSPSAELITRLSPDGLLLFFSSDRPGGFGQYGDGYVARRASRSAPWQPAVNLGPIVNATTFNWPIVSPDGSALYLLWDPNDDMSNWTYKAPILPIVDFNADSKVDLDDLRLLIENWGTDNTLYDIGPFAWGDGKVDIEDLKVFTAEWEKANPPAQP